jgi:hypothetical protein
MSAQRGEKVRKRRAGPFSAVVAALIVMLQARDSMRANRSAW